MAAAACWHPGFSQVATQGGRVAGASDLQGLAQVTAGGAGLGPQALTDGQGRRFWRFAGGQFVDMAAALVCAAGLTEPGAMHVHAGWCVINKGGLR